MHHRLATPYDARRGSASARRSFGRRRMWTRGRHAVTQRSGTATIELALIAPLLLLLTIGTIDVCSAIFLREAAVLAAYEGARQGVTRGNDNSDVQDRVEEFLNQRRIAFRENVVVINGTGFGAAATLEPVTVTVNIPAEGNLLIPSELIGDLLISADVTMLKEFENVQPN